MSFILKHLDNFCSNLQMYSAWCSSSFIIQSFYRLVNEICILCVSMKVTILIIRNFVLKRRNKCYIIFWFIIFFYICLQFISLNAIISNTLLKTICHPEKNKQQKKEKEPQRCIEYIESAKDIYAIILKINSCLSHFSCNLEGLSCQFTKHHFYVLAK